MPPYFLHKTLRLNCFHKTVIEAAAERPFWSAAGIYIEVWGGITPNHHFK